MSRRTTLPSLFCLEPWRRCRPQAPFPHVLFRRVTVTSFFTHRFAFRNIVQKPWTKTWPCVIYSLRFMFTGSWLMRAAIAVGRIVVPHYDPTAIFSSEDAGHCGNRPRWMTNIHRFCRILSGLKMNTFDCWSLISESANSFVLYGHPQAVLRVLVAIELACDSRQNGKFSRYFQARSQSFNRIDAFRIRQGEGGMDVHNTFKSAQNHARRRRFSRPRINYTFLVGTWYTLILSYERVKTIDVLINWAPMVKKAKYIWPCWILCAVLSLGDGLCG